MRPVDAAGIKVRQPLNKLKCQLTAVKSGENDYLDLIKAEVNVKVVELAEKVESEVELDTEITSELEAEGRLRELVRQINSLRKQANLTIADRIKIFWESDSGEVAEVFIKFADELKAQVLADEVASGAPAGLISAAVEINQQPVKITLAKV
jgi:isoleucyl-tRNA synthetase